VYVDRERVVGYDSRFLDLCEARKPSILTTVLPNYTRKPRLAFGPVSSLSLVCAGARAQHTQQCTDREVYEYERV